MGVNRTVRQRRRNPLCFVPITKSLSSEGLGGVATSGSRARYYSPNVSLTGVPGDHLVTR